MKAVLQFSGWRVVWILLVASMLILALDLLGIAMIFPFLSLFVEPEGFLRNSYGRMLFLATGLSNTRHFVYFVGLSLVAAYAFKLISKTLLSSVRHRAIAQINCRLSNGLFTGLLEAKYALFTEHAASEMINIVNAQTVHSVICLESLIVVAGELVFLAVMLGIGLYFDANATLLVLTIFAFLGAILYWGLMKPIQSFGQVHTRLNVLVYKYGYAMANSIKDIKIMRLEQKYINLFSDLWQEYSHNDSKSKTAKGINSDLSESVVFSGLVLVCLYLLLTEQDLKAVFPVLGVMAVSAMRLLPSFNRIASGVNQFRFYKPALLLVEDLARKIVLNRQAIAHVELPFRRELRIRSLSCHYGEREILEGLDITIERGGSYAFVGASGAGKSTLLDVIVGLREASSGSFVLDGVTFDPFNSDALRRLIGYVPQSVNLIDESLAFNIAFDRDYDRSLLTRVLGIARLTDFVCGLPAGVDTVLGEAGVRVSGGQKQRIGIARALYRNPEVLVFDEATSALDATTERELMQEISQLSGDKTLIIVAHRLSTVEKCTEIHLLDQGRIVGRGPHAELLASCPEYRALYLQQEQGQ